MHRLVLPHAVRPGAHGVEARADGGVEHVDHLSTPRPGEVELEGTGGDPRGLFDERVRVPPSHLVLGAPEHEAGVFDPHERVEGGDRRTASRRRALRLRRGVRLSSRRLSLLPRQRAEPLVRIHGIRRVAARASPLVRDKVDEVVLLLAGVDLGDEERDQEQQRDERRGRRGEAANPSRAEGHRGGVRHGGARIAVGRGWHDASQTSRRFNEGRIRGFFGGVSFELQRVPKVPESVHVLVPFYTSMNSTLYKSQHPIGRVRQNNLLWRKCSAVHSQCSFHRPCASCDAAPLLSSPIISETWTHHHASSSHSKSDPSSSPPSPPLFATASLMRFAFFFAARTLFGFSCPSAPYSTLFRA